MAIFVTRLIMFCLLFANANLAYAQSHSAAPLYIDEYSNLGKRMYVYSFLDKAIPQVQNGCTPMSDFFYFRVRTTGKIDSLYHNGYLPKEVTNKIIANIYSTEGHWKVKKGVRREAFCWFIFPYFSYGDNPYQNSACTEAEKKLQELLMNMAGNIVTLGYLLKNNNVILLSPSENGGGIV